MKRHLWLNFGMIAVLACAGQTHAAVLLSDTLRIQGQGAFADRQYFNSIVEAPNEGTELPNPIGNGIDQIYLPAPAGQFNPTLITILDPSGALSDSLRLEIIRTPIRTTEDSLLFTFTSGANAATGAVQVTETGVEQEVTALVFPGVALANAPYRVYFMSDVERAPEPAALTIMALGATLLVSGSRCRTADCRK
jgi:hypothetical protein